MWNSIDGVYIKNVLKVIECKFVRCFRFWKVILEVS